jgi:hypothetical protein
MSTFTAGVQYDDFKGTVAADIADNLSLANHLIEMGKANSDERVVAFRIASSAVRSTPVTDVSLVAYLTDEPQFNPAPKKLRAVEISLTPGEALAFFKRFDLVAKRDNVDLSGTTVDGPHYE